MDKKNHSDIEYNFRTCGGFSVKSFN